MFYNANLQLRTGCLSILMLHTPLGQMFLRTSDAVDPAISNVTDVWAPNALEVNILYLENAGTGLNPQKGSRVFVRKAPLPLAGGGSASSG